MKNLYPNVQPVYDQNGNQVGFMPIYQQPSQNRIGTPDWWPKNQQVSQSPVQQQNLQQAQIPPIQGKWVKAENDIVPMDIPQDGSVVVFPQTDLQTIYLKKWESDGTITTVPYIPNVPQKPQGPTPEQQFQTSVQQRLTNMEQMLVSLVKIWQSTPDANEEESK